MQYIKRLAGSGAGVDIDRKSDSILFNMNSDGLTIRVDVGFYKTWLVCMSCSRV
jgi:hypothetical protein